ncbi:uncharacterized protein [Temnothorax nylanderi]|uniref:uncharacterized protein isoform X1 n=1 Tax=Temnothorax nylanderi TaxID=102681 RepID=UPI003A86FD2C
MSEQIVNNPIKCGYCGYIMNGFLNNLLKHSCYQEIYDSELHEFCMDKTGMLVIVNKQEISVGNDSSSKCINKELDGNELNEADDVENGEFSDNKYDDYDDMMKNDPSGKKLGKAVEVYGPFASGKYDESLIGQVQLKPALYDSRLPAKQRAKKVKADLWKLIRGDFTPVNASRRWAYLRGCYCKARNKLMKEKAAFERSGAAANDDLKSSFRYYETMSFLNEPLTYKSTISSLKLKRKNANSTSNKENMEFNSQQTLVHDSISKERFVRPISALSNISDTINTVASGSSSNDSRRSCVSPISQSAIMPEVSPSPSRSIISTVSSQARSNTSTPHGITQMQFSPSEKSCTGAQSQLQRVFQQRPADNVLIQREVQSACRTLFPSSSNNRTQNLPSQGQSSSSNKKRTADVEKEIMKHIKTEPKKMDEIDSFAMRLAAGMRRLSYKARARVEIDFLTRLQQEKDLQDIDA